ncbi:MAG TPA: hypothetical protein VJX67_09550 [Blastocatellia bacterium]|nr:hypothetical protein [Blastocatellia bacterium]
MSDGCASSPPSRPEADLITKFQVQEMLGLETRFEVDALFKAYDVRDHHFTMEALERDRETAARLFDKR